MKVTEVDFKPIIDCVISGQKEKVISEIEIALEKNIPAEAILDRALIIAMEEVGNRYEQGNFFVPEMLIAARAMKEGLSFLKPYLIDAEAQYRGTVVIGTVKGDLHDIGKNLVSMMLEGAGFRVIDLGIDVATEAFVRSARENNAQIIGMSALLTTTVGQMKNVIEALEELGLRQQTRIMIGGAAADQTFADQIGADGYAPDASRAVSIAKELTATEKHM